MRFGILLARSLLFNLALWLWTGLLVIAALPLLAAPREKMVAIGRLWQQGAQALLARLAGLTYEVRGRERVPATPAIFAFKHQSAWETLVAPPAARPTRRSRSSASSPGSPCSAGTCCTPA